MFLWGIPIIKNRQITSPLFRCSRPSANGISGFRPSNFQKSKNFEKNGIFFTGKETGERKIHAFPG